MRLFSSLLLLGLTLASNSYGQASLSVAELDSALVNSTTDIQKVDLLNELSWRYRISDSALALDYADRAEDMASRIGYQGGKGSSYMRMGQIARYQGDHLIARDFYKKALTIRSGLEDVRGVASIYNSLGIIDNIDGAFSDALTNFNLGLSVLRPKEFLRMQGRLNNNIGKTHYLNGDHITAIRYLEKSMSIREETQDERGKMDTYLDLGNVYLMLHSLEQSQLSYAESMRIAERLGDNTAIAKCSNSIAGLHIKSGDTNQALEYLYKALKLQQYLDYKDRAQLQNNFGIAFQKKGNQKEALTHFENAVATSETNSLVEPLIKSYYNLGISYFELEDLNQSVFFFQKSLDSLEGTSDILMKTNVYHRLSEVYASQGKYDLAFKFENRATLLQDTLNESVQKTINYELNRQVALKNKANLDLEVVKNERQTLIIRALSTAIGLGLIAFTAIIMAYRTRQKRILQKKETEQKVSSLLKDQEIKATYARLEGQDAERQRISQDLHDRLGSMLSTVKLYFKAIDTKLDHMQDENVEHYVKANELLDQACEEVRKVSHDLQSGILTKFGLQEELRSLAESIKESNQLHVDVVVHGLNRRLSSKIEVKVYRIIQELVGNVIRHAHASKLVIQLNKFPEVLNIVVEDDGRGFVSEIAQSSGGMGLLNVESRVLDLAGEMHIDSGSGNGTTITIDVPCSGNDVLQSNTESVN